MISRELRDQYTATIGIECHVQLNTATKLFAAVGNDARDAEPNTLVSHICFGMPGALPVLNDEVVHRAMKVAFALNTEPQRVSYFERKHYFYPDLPKGYQITQLSKPIIIGGSVLIEVGDERRAIRINRVQIEEDAGKSSHPEGKDYSLVDLNRAGTPLLEIVSEPDIHSAEEAKAYARELYLLMRYTNVSDADMFHGNMRFDVNVSVSKDQSRLGTRTETKNLNSFRSIEKAVEFEINRQIELLEKGKSIIQETRGWDEAKQKTFSQRGKEEAHDYRYFPDPDLPPVELDESKINKVAEEMPVLPMQWRDRLKHLGLDSSQINTLLEAEIEATGVSHLGILEELSSKVDEAKAVANLLVNVEIPLRREAKVENDMNNDVRTAFYREIYRLQQEGKLSSTNAKALLTGVLTSGAQPKDIEKYATEQGYIQVSDEKEIAAIVDKVISDNPKAAEDVKNGEMKAIGFLVGQVMKASQGKANPGLTQQLIRQRLGVG